MTDFATGLLWGSVLGGGAMALLWLMQKNKRKAAANPPVTAKNAPPKDAAEPAAEQAAEQAAESASPNDSGFIEASQLLQKKQASNTEEALATTGTDAVTQLPLRQSFLDSISRWLFQEHRGAVLMVRFPRAPLLRSSLGPEAADALMLAIAQRLKEQTLPIGAVGRLSSSSFGLLLDVPGSAEAAAAAYALSSSLAKPFQLGAREVQLSSIMGIAMLEGLQEASAALHHAEIAAQSSQSGGRDDVVLFDMKMRRSIEERHEIETDLRRAIYFEREQLSLAYQPIVELNSTRLSGFEALIRWKHPQKGFISPVDFISIAEQTGLIVPLWHFVFSLACRQLLEWQMLRPRGTPPLFISVNLSSFQFFYPGLLKSVQAMVELTGVEPAWVKLEITESGLMENAELALQQLNALKEIGFSLSIDDFGTGYSSLSYLHQLPADDLKIDRSFVRNMNSAEDNREIVRTISQLGRLLGMQVTAEGIETIEELRALRQLKCDFGQGYYFARPMPAAEAEVLVRAMGTPLADEL